MAIRFQCPTCKVVRAVNERLLGREIKCPECAAAVQLPSREQVEKGRSEKVRAAREEQALQAALQRLEPVASVVAFDDYAAWQEEQASMLAEERALAAAAADFTRPKTPVSQDMDMTPMVDVTFLLLIFFMITASFSVQKSIQRPAQKQDEPSTAAIEIPPDENPDIVTVQVDEYNAYTIITPDWDRTAGSKQDLIVALNEAHASRNRPSKLLVQAHEDCFHASVISALDAGREAQFESFEVSSVEQFD